MSQKVEHYSAAPQYGLHGRWAPEIRMSGLGPLMEECRGKSILDLGAAEGLIANRFLEHGAVLVHGFEIVPDRVTAARRVCAAFPSAEFWQADLANWPAFRACHAEHLLTHYDLVLYLGLHHHLPVATRDSTLQGAAAMSAAVIAVRTPDICYDQARIAETLRVRGFRLWQEHRHTSCSELGTLRIFQRREAGPDEKRGS